MLLPRHQISFKTYLSIYLPIFLSIYPGIHLSIHPSNCLCIYLSINRSIFLCFYLQTFFYLYIHFIPHRSSHDDACTHPIRKAAVAPMGLLQKLICSTLFTSGALTRLLSGALPVVILHDISLSLKVVGIEVSTESIHGS